MTLAEYLVLEGSRGVIDFAIRAMVPPDGIVSFSIHPAHRDGVTRDYLTQGERIVPDPRVSYEGDLDEMPSPSINEDTSGDVWAV
jgi:hypothetical protein